jgi:hypothetical protein
VSCTIQAIAEPHLARSNKLVKPGGYLIVGLYHWYSRKSTRAWDDEAHGWRQGDGTFEVYVTPSSSLRVLDFRKSLVDRVHERFIREWMKADAIVWDIGANLGLFALPAALKTIAGRVYAFEPDVELIERPQSSVTFLGQRGPTIGALVGCMCRRRL